MTNPIHDNPGCTRPSRKDGKSSAGRQRYYCPDCQHWWTADPGKPGRPTIGDRPMTSTERSRRSRAGGKTLPEQLAAAHVALGAANTTAEHNRLARKIKRLKQKIAAYGGPNGNH